MQVSIISMLSVLETYYDNSKPFLKFLKKQGLDEVLKREKVRLRETHMIVPHVGTFLIEHIGVDRPF